MPGNIPSSPLIIDITAIAMNAAPNMLQNVARTEFL